MKWNREPGKWGPREQSPNSSTHTACMCVLSYSVESDSLQPHRLQPARLLYPWNSPGKNTRVGCHFLLQRIFPTQGSNPHLLHWQADSLPLSHLGSPQLNIQSCKKQLSFMLPTPSTDLTVAHYKGLSAVHPIVFRNLSVLCLLHLPWLPYLFFSWDFSWCLALDSTLHLDLIFEFYLLPTPSSETQASIPICSLTKSLFPFPHSPSLSQFWNSWLLAFLGKEVSNRRADRLVLKLTWVVTEVILCCDFRKSVSMLHAFPWS